MFPDILQYDGHLGYFPEFSDRQVSVVSRIAGVYFLVDMGKNILLKDCRDRS